MPDIITILLIILFLLVFIVAFYLGNRFGVFRRDRHWERELPNHRRDAILKSRSVLSGQFSEQLAPYLPDFEYSPTECKFLGKPIDMIVFKGMDEKDINEVVFLEVKSGKSKLSSQERKLKEAIQKKRVKWQEYRIPEELTKGKDIEDIS